MVQTTADGDSSGDLTYSAYADLQVNSIATANFALPSADGADGQVLTTDGLGNVTWETPAGGGGAVWGGITGTLSAQTDLNSALGGKYSTSGGLINGNVSFGGSKKGIA